MAIVSRALISVSRACRGEIAWSEKLRKVYNISYTFLNFSESTEMSESEFSLGIPMSRETIAIAIKKKKTISK